MTEHTRVTLSQLQAKAARARRIMDDARVLEKAGAFSIILQLVPDRIARAITERSQGAIIMSLGSGPHVHGQLLVHHDMFGLYPRFKPRMAKVHAGAADGADGAGAADGEAEAGSPRWTSR